MKKSHFIRIFLSYVLIVLTGSVLIGLLSIQLIKYYLLNSAQTRMYSNIRLIETNLTEYFKKDSEVDFNYLAKKYSGDTGITVAFLNAEGKVIGEKLRSSEGEKDYKNNQEVIDAKKEEFGSKFFYNDQFDVYILSLARNIRTDKFSGYIHLTTSMDELKKANEGIVVYLLLGVIFVMFSSFVLKIFFEKDIINPLQKILDVSQNVDNDINRRVDIISDDIIGLMANEYNKMLDRIQNKITSVQKNSKDFEFSFDNLDIGVIIADSEQKVVFANSFAAMVFDEAGDKGQLRGKSTDEFFKDSNIDSCMKDALGDGIQRELEIVKGEKQRNYKILIKPMTNDNAAGCLVITYDVTQIVRLESIGADFVSNVTHELKTPLTSIKGFVETLKEGAIEDKAAAYKFIDIIDTECDRLYSLINDILQLAQLQNAKEDVNKDFFHIQEIAHEVISLLESQASKKEITLLEDVQEDIPLVLINRNRIRQMLMNIIENAIKYTNNGGRVILRLRKEEENIVISIRDNGIGIPKEAIPRLFERFYRVDKGRSRSHGGTGLGLSIVKHIVELYNGEIVVNSEVGEGTEFLITLPVSY